MENQHTRWGAIAKQLPFTPGKIFFVLSSSDTNYGEFQREFPADNDGKVRVFTSLPDAYDATTTNCNDVIVVNAYSSHSLTGVLDVSKSRVHFVGLDWLMGIRRHYGQRARISIGVTTDTDDIAAIKNTGVGNSFRGLKISSSNTLTEGKYAFADGGEYTYMENCELYLSSQLTVTTAAELLLNGDGSKYVNCTIGSNVNEVTANGARPNVLLNRETITGKVCRDSMFVGCFFLYKAGDTDNRFVYGSGATDVERMLLFKDCIFHNTKLASQTMTLGAHTASALTEGYMLFKDCANIGTTDFATQTGIFVSNGAANAANGGEVIQAA